MEQTLTKIMAEIFNISEHEITPASSVETIESWDSLKHMELVTAIEEAFDVIMTADEIVSMRDFGRIMQIVQHKTSEM